jgi:pyrimidine operon attenuation protein/uracil phosphoribosyltransferase
MAVKVILSREQLQLTIQRLSHQLIENHYPFADTVIVGLQPRGVLLAEKMVQVIKQAYPDLSLKYGKLDITFYRDDLHKELHVANQTTIDFEIENKQVILIDDVLYTGRTIRAAMDALIDFGRPSKVELCVLVDRRFNRQLPIQPDYTGRAIDTIFSQNVTVDWKEEQVLLIE